MKNKIILGCKNQTNIVALLDGEFILIPPKVHVINSEIVTNFDVLLNFEVNDLSDVPDGLINKMGGPRLEKPYQSVILGKLNIDTPGTYANMDNNATFNQSLLANVNDETPLFLKSNLGARGLGQTIINRNKLEVLTDKIYGNNDKQGTILQLEKEYLVGGDEDSKTGEHRDFLYDTIKNGSYHFNKVINIKKEFRVIGLYGMDSIVIERTVEPYQWQANSGITGNGVYLESTPYMNEFNKYAQLLLNELKTPWLSIDFYIDERGQIGVFEFQMEMGYKFVPKKLLTNGVRQAVHNYIKDKFKDI